MYNNLLCLCFLLNQKSFFCFPYKLTPTQLILQVVFARLSHVKTMNTFFVHFLSVFPSTTKRSYRQQKMFSIRCYHVLSPIEAMRKDVFAMACYWRENECFVCIYLENLTNWARHPWNISHIPSAEVNSPHEVDRVSAFLCNIQNGS